MGRIFLRFSGRAGKDEFIDAVNELGAKSSGRFKRRPKQSPQQRVTKWKDRRHDDGTGDYDD